MNEKTVVLVDGENLVFRYQAMLKAGRKPRSDVAHLPDQFVWSNQVLEGRMVDLLRINYYTSMVGDEGAMHSLRKTISNTQVRCIPQRGINQIGQLVPRVFKKSSKSEKTSICDMAIAVEAMRSAYMRQAEIMLLITGDGDFLELVKEVAHAGIVVQVAALSNGLSPELPLVADDFRDLDSIFFE